MTLQEFSDQFDTLLDSHKFEDEFGKVDNNYRIRLDEYEKSVLLTEAQDILLRMNFDINFDKSEQGQIYFSNITAVAEGVENLTIDPYSTDGKVYDLPNDLFWPLNERVIDSEGRNYTILPINFREYDRIQSKPYAKPLKRQAWRILQKGETSEDTPTSEIIMRNDNTIAKYLVRYIRKPNPIILEDLGELSIHGVSTPSECELNPLAHFDILLKAVELAMSRYAPQRDDNNNNN